MMGHLTIKFFGLMNKIALFALLLLIGCYYDNEATLYPESANCTPLTTSTFSGNVLPLLNNRCNNCPVATIHQQELPLTLIRL